MWAGLAAGDLDLVATDHVPDRAAVEKGDALRGVSFDRISNGAPGIETLLAVAYGEGVGRGRLTLERLVDVLSTTPARRFGLRRKGADRGRAGRRSRPLRPGGAADHRGGTPPSHERLHALRGPRGRRGTVRSVYVRGRAVIRDGAFVGDRGYGRFVEREGAGE